MILFEEWPVVGSDELILNPFPIYMIFSNTSRSRKKYRCFKVNIEYKKIIFVILKCFDFT